MQALTTLLFSEDGGMALDISNHQRGGGVLVVSFRNPEGRGNAMTAHDARSLSDHLHSVVQEMACAAIVLKGAEHFCAGADLSDVPDKVLMGDNLRRYWGPLVMTIDSAPVPVVAAIEGVAAGGGLSLALACQARVMSRTARLVPGFLQLGLVPDAGASYHLVRMLGAGRAYRWLASGEPVGSDVAGSWRLIDVEADPGTLEATAVRFARELASPEAPLQETWQLLQRAIGGGGLAAAIEAEAAVQDRLGREPSFWRARERFLRRR